jgi:uncharacterized repeat protein (TIGR03803 family)
MNAPMFGRSSPLSRPAILFLTLPLSFAVPVAAQSYTVLHAFDGTDGSASVATLVQGSDGNLYGTTSSGGTFGLGTVFAATPAGVLTSLYSFAGSDGRFPIAGLVEGTGGTFYGTTSRGGSSDKGTVFRITSDRELATLHSFSGGDGERPLANLVQGTDGNFYGTTFSGGVNGSGTVFRITPAGALTTLASFATLTIVNTPAAGTGALVQADDGSFWGTTVSGGANGFGMVFRITPSGVLTTLHSFIGSDGMAPAATLVPAGDGTFYGTTPAGGSGDPSLPVAARAGTVFHITAAGALTTFYSFTGSGGQVGGATLARGSDGNFWGTTATGGKGCGTVFRMTPEGDLTTLVELPATFGTGCTPWGALAQARDGNFYGTTALGGPFSSGVVFRLTRDPELFLPIVLDDVTGQAGSLYTTELTLASRAATPIPVTLAYTASVGSGSGSVSVTLAARETRIVPNAIEFLRKQGLAIPAGPTVGTLRATFVGATDSDRPFLGGRTFTAADGGTYGVFTPDAPTTTTTATLAGLRQDADQRSNIALANPGAAPLSLRVQLYGPLGEDLGARTETLPAYGWTQINAPLEGKASSGRAVVSGTSPFTAYAVLNDAATSDGAFIPPLLPTRGPGVRFVPIVLDVHGAAGSHYTTELTVANLTPSRMHVVLAYHASLGTGSGSAFLELGPGEQRILPDVIALLRSQGLDIPADGRNVGGSLHVLADPGTGTPDSAFAVGARTFTPAPSGRGTFGVYMPGLTSEEEATSVAWVDGLQQNASQRSNLGLVNCGNPGPSGSASDSITLEVRFFNGAGTALWTTSVTLAPGEWTQLNQPLAGFGASSGYARIEKTSGQTPFVAYGILNDAVTSDGSYVPMRF